MLRTCWGQVNDKFWDIMGTFCEHLRDVLENCCRHVWDKLKTLQELIRFMVKAEIIKMGVVTIGVSSIGIKFENFMQAGCRDLSL